MADVPRIPGDPFTSPGRRIADRPEMHETMRRAGPVVCVEAPAGGPAWVITDETLARQVLADTRFVKDPARAPAHWHGRDPGLEPPAAEVRALTTLDGPEHRCLRRVHAPAFTRRRVLAHRDRIAAIARDLLTELAERSAGSGQPIDLIADFASRYPLMVICDLLGVPLADLDRAAHASHLMTHGDIDNARAGLAELESFVAATIRASHEHDIGTTLTDLLAERTRAVLGEVDDDELLYMITGLIFAGQVTTESFLGFLLAHQLAGDLGSTADSNNKNEADAVEAFVTETLRLYPPAPFTLWRFTTTDVDLAGVTLPTGAPVLVDIEGINTDPRTRTAPHTPHPGPVPATSTRSHLRGRPACLYRSAACPTRSPHCRRRTPPRLPRCPPRRPI